MLKSHLKIFSDTLKWCAKQKKAYHVVTAEDLTKVTESVHHEGVCFLAKRQRYLTQDEFLNLRVSGSVQAKGQCCIYFDGVQNPHNIGSIMRSAAHFGVVFVFGNLEKLNAFTPSAYRIAKGGFEFVKWVDVKEPAKLLAALKKKNFTLVATDSAAKSSIYATKLPNNCVLVMGGETSGVSQMSEKHADLVVTIPGSEHLPSLNVSAAAAVLLSEYWRTHA